MYQELAAHIRDIGTIGIDLLAGFVFPPTCAGCNAVGSWLCEICTEELDAIDLQSHSSDNFHYADSQIALQARYAYADPVRRAIHLLKYERQRARAVWFAKQLAPLVVAETLHVDSVFEPVPLTARRERERGFNQSRVIARHLSIHTGLPLGDGIRRIRETRPQVELNGLERLANVRGAFAADQSVAGKRVVLIDDVITTGATMRECAAACFEAGATSVVGLAVAIGQR